jgi:hypothetical protein
MMKKLNWFMVQKENQTLCKMCPSPFEITKVGFRMLNLFNLHNEEIPLGFLTFRMATDTIYQNYIRVC